MPNATQTIPSTQDQVTLGLESLLPFQDYKQPDWTVVDTSPSPSHDTPQDQTEFVRQQMEGLYVDPLKTHVEAARQALKKLMVPPSEQNRVWRRQRPFHVQTIRALFEHLEEKTIPFLMERTQWT